MEREALQPDYHDPSELGRLDVDIPPRLAGIKVSSHAPVVANGVDEAPHVVDEETAGARLVDEHHGPGGRPVDVRKGCELLEPDDDRALGRRDRVRERVR